jgi:hypothetical protein
MADTAIVILTGQSLNAWRGSTRFLETGWSGARQFVGGGAALEMDFAAINETETPDHNDTASVVTQAETTGGQSPIAGIASALSGAGFTRVYLYSAAIGSRAYDAQFGSGIFQSVVTGVQRMIELAAGQGDTDPDIFFYHAHGEADAISGRTAEQYRDDSILWIQRLQLLAAQYLERPAYRAPVFFSMPIQNKTPTGGSDASNDIAIKHGIKLAADSANVSEVYILPTYSTVILPEADLVHPDEASFVRRGEYVGFLIKDYLAGTVYEPLRITSVTRSGATVTVQFTHDIVRDATENWGGNLNGVDGFEYFDNGSEIAISGVVYSGDTATITLNSTPAGSDAQQVLRLGMQVTETSALPNQANICGTVIRKTGAGVASVTNVGVTHHDFAIQEEISGFPYDYTPPSPGGTIGDVTIGGTIGDLSTVAFDATRLVTLRSAAPSATCQQSRSTLRRRWVTLRSAAPSATCQQSRSTLRRRWVTLRSAAPSATCQRLHLTPAHPQRMASHWTLLQRSSIRCAHRCRVARLRCMRATRNRLASSWCLVASPAVSRQRLTAQFRSLLRHHTR